MSTPRNHHFVSQIHLKNFFNTAENKIFVYDKLLDNHYPKTTTKTLFSEKDSNTRYVNNVKDFSTLENDLNKHFEKDFSKNYSIIEKLIENLEMTKSVNDALYYFAKYGVIGDMRTPRHKNILDDALWNSLGTLIPMSEPQLKKRLEEIFEYRKEIKYSNFVEYSEISEEILELMGGLIIKIIIPKNKGDYFVVPDCSSVTIRGKINTYFNPDLKEIAYIGLPISSKIYVHFYSEKLFKEKKISSGLVYEDSLIINKLNKFSLDFCQSKIACKNQEYLKKFISEIKNFA